MKEEKGKELTRIDVVSVFRFFGGIFFIVGLIVGLFGNILRINIMSTQVIRTFPFLAGLGHGIFSGIAFGIIYGFCAAVGFSIFALLYNFFAALFGGLKFNIKD